jgi:dTDP-4-amino-4,6-dideoxygalactose transaminase
VQVARYDYRDQFGAELPPLLRDIERMLREGSYVLSREVREFETSFAKYLDTPHVLGVNSGTDALLLALRALGVGPGDEVITQANTFHATVAAICLAGATPVLVDAQEESFLIDPDQLAASVTTRTRAIIPVHLYGKPMPLGPIQELARKHGVEIIEDAAQAHGARVGGRRVGTIGRIGCFSFHPSKNLAAAGDGGAVATHDPLIAERIEQLRGLGQSKQNHHVMIGYNSKLDAIQARILSAKLPYLDAWNDARRRIAIRYREQLDSAPVRFQRTDPDEEHVYHLFQVRSDRRDQLLQHLIAANVDATVRYPTPIHRQPAFAEFGWKQGQFPVAERLAIELLCLPIRPNLTDAEIDYVTKCIHMFFGLRI